MTAKKSGSTAQKIKPAKQQQPEFEMTYKQKIPGIVLPSPFGRRYPVRRPLSLSPGRLAHLRNKYGSRLWHKALDRPYAAMNTAERYVAGLDGGNEAPNDPMPTAP
jgi:hypothetical protein